MTLAQRVLDYDRQRNEYLNRSHREMWGFKQVRREAERISRLYDALVEAAKLEVS